MGRRQGLRTPKATGIVTRIEAFAPDLMDQSKLRAAFADHDFGLLRSIGALADSTADLLLVDLGRPGVLETIEALTASADFASRQVVGFGSHVDEELLAAATAAGATQVLARSVFFRRIPNLTN